MPLKRFLVFSWCTYYPCGGFRDLWQTHDTAADAVASIEEFVSSEDAWSRDWFQIVDTETSEVRLLRWSGESLDEA